jgi:hypothetical protein
MKNTVLRHFERSGPMLYCALRGKTKEERGVTDYLSDSLQVGAPSPLFFVAPLSHLIPESAKVVEGGVTHTSSKGICR